MAWAAVQHKTSLSISATNIRSYSEEKKKWKREGAFLRLWLSEVPREGVKYEAYSRTPSERDNGPGDGGLQPKCHPSIHQN